MVWFQSSHGARFWFLISSSTEVCEILELTRSLDEYWTGTCPAQWCSVDLGHVGCQGNDTVKRKEQLQDKDEVIPLLSPKIHSWVNWGCAEQIQAVASVLHPCSRNITQRTKSKALVQKPNNKFSILCSNFCLARGQMPRCGFAAFAVQQQHIFLRCYRGISAGSWSYPRWPSCGRKQKCCSLNSLERCFLLEFSVSGFTAARCFSLWLVWDLIWIRGTSVPGLTWGCTGQRLSLSHLCAATPDGSSSAAPGISPELLWELGETQGICPGCRWQSESFGVGAVPQEWAQKGKPRVFHSW